MYALMEWNNVEREWIIRTYLPVQLVGWFQSVSEAQMQQPFHP